MDRLQTLEIFVRVAEAGSFTRAADLLQLPRSTVSAAVQTLENRMRTRLIHRTTRKMQLTADGSAYLAWCQRLLADIAETEQRFRSGEYHPRGLLRVSVPGRIARLLVVPALPAFLARYPDIEMEIGVTDRPVDLIDESIDCAIRVGTVREPQLVTRPIGMLRQANFASPGYLAKYGTPRSVGDLGEHLAVNYEPPGTGQVLEWEYLEGGVRRTLSMRSKLTVNCAESYIAACLAGLGLIQIPAYDAAGHVAAGELVEVLPDATAAPLPMAAVLPARHYTSLRVSVFVDWMRDIHAQSMLG